MKTINITYTEQDYTNMLKIKSKHGGNWHDFILDIVRDYDLKLKGEQGAVKDPSQASKK